MTGKIKPHCVHFLDVVPPPQQKHNSHPPLPTPLSRCSADVVQFNLKSRLSASYTLHRQLTSLRLSEPWPARCFPYFEVLKLLCLLPGNIPNSCSASVWSDLDEGARKTWLCTWRLRAQSIDESCSPVDTMLNSTRAWGKLWRQKFLWLEIKAQLKSLFCGRRLAEDGAGPLFTGGKSQDFMFSHSIRVRNNPLDVFRRESEASSVSQRRMPRPQTGVRLRWRVLRKSGRFWTMTEPQSQRSKPLLSLTASCPSSSSGLLQQWQLEETESIEAWSLSVSSSRRVRLLVLRASVTFVCILHPSDEPPWYRKAAPSITERAANTCECRWWGSVISGLPVRPTGSGKQECSSLMIRVCLIFHPARYITEDEPAKSQEIYKKPWGIWFRRNLFHQWRSPTRRQTHLSLQPSLT